MFNIKDLIVPSKFVTKTNDGKVETIDYVYIETLEKEFERVPYNTDYSFFCGATWGTGGYNKVEIWLRSENTGKIDIADDFEEDWLNMRGCVNKYGICPTMKIAVSKFTESIKIENKTIKLGDFPQEYVGSELNGKLEKWLAEGKVKETGKTYIGRKNEKSTDCNEYIQNKEYFFDKTKYVRCLNSYNQICWCKVSPIVWYIKNFNNWQEDKYMEITTKNAIIGGMYSHKKNKDITNKALWKNCVIRAYLNGINVNSADLCAPNGGDFSGKSNFLSEAFDCTNIFVNIKPIQNEKAEKEIDEIFKKALNNINIKDEDFER